MKADAKNPHKQDIGVRLVSSWDNPAWNLVSMCYLCACASTRLDMCSNYIYPLKLYSAPGDATRGVLAKLSNGDMCGMRGKAPRTTQILFTCDAVLH